MNLLLVEPAREGPGLLDDLLARHPDLRVLARVASAQEVPHALREMPTHRGLTALVSLDLSGDQDALWLIRTIRQYFPTFRILAFGTAVGRAKIEDAFLAGADGYLDSAADPNRLAAAMRQSNRNVVLVEPARAPTAVREGGEAARPSPSAESQRRPEPPPPERRTSGTEQPDGRTKKRRDKEEEHLGLVEPADGVVLLSGVQRAPTESKPPDQYERAEREATGAKPEREEPVEFVDPGEGTVLLPGPSRTGPLRRFAWWRRAEKPPPAAPPSWVEPRPKPRPVPEPEPEPVVEAEPEPVPEPEPEPVVEAEPERPPLPEPIPPPVPEPVPQPEPPPEPLPRPEPFPEPEPAPEPLPRPEPVPQPEPVPEPVPQAAPVPQVAPALALLEQQDMELVLVGLPIAHRERAAAALGVQPTRIRWLPSATAAEAFLGDHRGDSFVVLVAPSIKREDALGMAEYVSRLDPATGVLLLGDRSDQDLLLSALRAGIREVVDPTASGPELAQAVVRAVEAAERIRSTRETEAGAPAGVGGTVISMFSSKGGTGSSFLAANLGAALAIQSRADTAVVDLDLELGDTLSYFGEEPSVDLDGLVGLVDQTDRVGVRRTGLHVGDHLWAFAAKPDRMAAERMSGDTLVKILRTFQRNFAYTVIDTAPVYNDQTLAALDVADVICLVASLDVVALRHLSSALNTLLSLGIPRTRFLLVLNRANSKVRLSASEVERVLRLRIDAMIPSSRRVPLSLNKGRPVYLDEPGSDIARSIGAFAERIHALYPQAPEFPGEPMQEGRPRHGLLRKG